MIFKFGEGKIRRSKGANYLCGVPKGREKNKLSFLLGVFCSLASLKSLSSDQNSPEQERHFISFPSLRLLQEVYLLQRTDAIHFASVLCFYMTSGPGVIVSSNADAFDKLRHRYCLLTVK
jgi:hypothetical protein